MRSQTTLSHRDRVRLALDHQPTDRVPIALVCSGVNPSARAALEEYLRRERGLTVDEYLAPLLDIRNLGPAYRGPSLPPRTDVWGVRRAPVSYGAGEYQEIEHYPLAAAETLADVADHAWPDPDWWDDDGFPAVIARTRAAGDWCLLLANHNPFELTWYQRGFERTLLDLLTRPELIHAILDRVTSFLEERLRRALAAAGGAIDLVFTADDIAGQQGLLMSLGMWSTHLRPYHERLNRVVHERGARVIYHSDGAVQTAVPGLLDAGIDILQALQFDAVGMDPADLKSRFGDRLCFQGGVSVQQTLPFGTADDVRREVEHLVATLGRGGGYILGPSHAIQAGTPPENVVAMFDEARRPRG